MDVEILPATNEARQLAFLAFTAILGSGAIAYEAARSIKEGDLLKTDPVPEKPEVGVVAAAGGLAMLGIATHELSKEVGWKPIVYGAAGVSAFVFVVRAIRR